MASSNTNSRLYNITNGALRDSHGGIWEKQGPFKWEITDEPERSASVASDASSVTIGGEDFDSDPSVQSSVPQTIAGAREYVGKLWAKRPPLGGFVPRWSSSGSEASTALSPGVELKVGKSDAADGENDGGLEDSDSDSESDDEFVSSFGSDSPDGYESTSSMDTDSSSDSSDLEPLYSSDFEPEYSSDFTDYSRTSMDTDSDSDLSLDPDEIFRNEYASTYPRPIDFRSLGQRLSTTNPATARSLLQPIIDRYTDPYRLPVPSNQLLDHLTLFTLFRLEKEADRVIDRLGQYIVVESDYSLVAWIDGAEVEVPPGLGDSVMTKLVEKRGLLLFHLRDWIEKEIAARQLTTACPKSALLCQKSQDRLECDLRQITHLRALLQKLDYYGWLARSVVEIREMVDQFHQNVKGQSLAGCARCEGFLPLPEQRGFWSCEGCTARAKVHGGCGWYGRWKESWEREDGVASRPRASCAGYDIFGDWY
ncbi:hypothetical protein BJ508DRAFT_359744 [Ascobolus immersus RN42]|uniref:Uncharacterized protein n=1 Tax=Ascobolus immersus RN42 TaxID=1160509 RepID=A0A3N4IG03_ASCIM|nr:hypothetical protein BJ508DRAFT_359744 [Ascobolus immersus RN42]